MAKLPMSGKKLAGLSLNPHQKVLSLVKMNWHPHPPLLFSLAGRGSISLEGISGGAGELELARASMGSGARQSLGAASMELGGRASTGGGIGREDLDVEGGLDLAGGLGMGLDDAARVSSYCRCSYEFSSFYFAMFVGHIATP